MLLLIHVIIALSSVAFTSYLYFVPSKVNFYMSYGLVGLTLGSGTYLVISSHAPMLRSCANGLVYIGVVLVGIVAARRKLATGKASTDKTD